jgi:hypothetical protein
MRFAHYAEGVDHIISRCCKVSPVHSPSNEVNGHNLVRWHLLIQLF